MREKVLLLVRHAHRDKPMGSAFDNGLSKKGRRQAQKLARHYRDRLRGAYFVSSPKIRCVETLQPLSKKIRIDPFLDEGPRMAERVNAFLKWWKTKGPSLVVVCSHGDWLPMALKKLTRATIEMEKGAAAEIHSSGLYELIQKF